MQAVTLTSNSQYFFNFLTWKIKIINFKNSDFCKLLRLPISPILKIQKYFLRVCWFLCKNLSNFVPLAWKLHNPYCHSTYIFDKNINIWRSKVLPYFRHFYHSEYIQTSFIATMTSIIFLLEIQEMMKISTEIHT